MRKATAAAGSVAHFALQPAVVAGLVPWWLTGWRVRHPAPSWAWTPLRLAGMALLTVAVPVLVHAFVRFVVEGVGTPAPIAPTRRLVVGGPYRYVRNPMYLAVTAAIVGQALALGQPGLLAYAAVVGAFTAAFAHGYEEPALHRRFGAQYEAYRRAVPAWWPRRRPWQPDQANQPARHPTRHERDRCHGQAPRRRADRRGGVRDPPIPPQLLKLRATDDVAGVSWPWATLTSVNNGAWVGYFALSAYWTALVPSCSATLLAGALATMLARRGQARARPAVLIGAWAALLAAAFAAAGRAGLGALLTAAFVLQVTPSLWTAYRTARPTGISQGTWLLIFGELSCWTIFGVHKADPRLTILGVTGVAASLLMLARIRRTTQLQQSTPPRRVI